MDPKIHIGKVHTTEVAEFTIEPKPGGGFIARFSDSPLVVEADTREALIAKISEEHSRAWKRSMLQQGFMPAGKDGKLFIRETEPDLPFGPSASKTESVFRSLSFALGWVYRAGPIVEKISIAVGVLALLWFLFGRN